MAIPAAARNEFLFTVATTLSQRNIDDAKAVDAVASEIGAEIVARHQGAGFDGKDLVESLPAPWRSSPNGARDEMKAFTQVAGSVLQVPVAELSPLAARATASLDAAARAIAINGARLAQQQTSPVLDRKLTAFDRADTAVLAVFQDRVFLQRSGGERTRHALSGEVTNRVLAAFEQLRRDEPVSGPVHVTARIAAGGTAGEVATALVQAHCAAFAVHSSSFQTALHGEGAFVNDFATAPYYNYLPLHVQVAADGALEVGVALDGEALARREGPVGDDGKARVVDLIQRTMAALVAEHARTGEPLLRIANNVHAAGAKPLA